MIFRIIAALIAKICNANKISAHILHKRIENFLGLLYRVKRSKSCVDLIATQLFIVGKAYFNRNTKLLLCQNRSLVRMTENS